MTLTTVQPRSSRWRRAPGQPTASSSGCGATCRMVGATNREVTPVGPARPPGGVRRRTPRRALFTDYSESNILTGCRDGPDPIHWPWPSWSACTRSRCTPTRWRRRCGPGPSRRASVSITALSTPWSNRSRRRASSRPPAPSARGSGPQRTVYEITDDGATEMTDWLTELIGTPAKEYPAFMAGLSFLPALDPDDALAALRRRAEMLDRQAGVACAASSRRPATPACRASSPSSRSTRRASSSPS